MKYKHSAAYKHCGYNNYYTYNTQQTLLHWYSVSI